MDHKVWARVKWKEGSKIKDDTIPFNWVDEDKMIVYWPDKNQYKCLSEHANPKASWTRFPLLRKKLVDKDEQLCVDYEFTTADEEDNQDSSPSIENGKTPPSAVTSYHHPPVPSPPLTNKRDKKASTPKSFMNSFKDTWGVSHQRGSNLSGHKKHLKRAIAKKLSRDDKSKSPVPPKLPRMIGDDEEYGDLDETDNNSPPEFHIQDTCDDSPGYSMGKKKEEDKSAELLKYAKKSFQLLMEIKNLLTAQSNISVNDGQKLFDKSESMSDVDEQDDVFNDNQKRKETVTYFQGIGGSDFKDHTKNIMKRLFSGVVMSQMNIYGNGGKVGFTSKPSLQLVIDDVKGRHKDVTESEVKKMMQDYLRNAPACCKGKEKDN